jgi:hypothetical protein
MAPTAAVLLAAWEAGAAEAPVDRAPSLLASLGLLAADDEVHRLTVGQCDRHLLRLRRSLFGDVVEASATCPVCGSDVELSLSLTHLTPPAGDLAEPALALERDGYTITCRIPLNQDLCAVAELGERAAPSDLLGRCLLRARDGAGRPVTVEELPVETAAAVIDALAQSDPGAQVPLGIRCPCGAEWVDELDIRLILWSELTDWVGRTLTLVHQLAHSYGWSESEILAMSPWRRNWYLEAAGW